MNSPGFEIKVSQPVVLTEDGKRRTLLIRIRSYTALG